jgi:deazaflavin-dependent oxidoreductase (nitroreductase family)
MQTQLQKSRTPLIARVFLWLLIITISASGAFILASIALAKAMRLEWTRDRIRQFNRRTLNPATLSIAGNRLRIYSAIEHMGRRSGRAYSTPVVAVPFGDGFVVPLPYGTSVDWYRNVQAAGTCTLRWNEQEYALERPELLTQAEALDAFPWLQRIIFDAGGVDAYLWLHTQKKASVSVTHLYP